jgi:hypothetical protein
LFVLAYKIKPGTPEERAAAVAQFRTAAALSRQVALLGAKAVQELERTGAHHAAGGASIAHFGEMNGLSAAEARTWSNLARAISHPESAAAARDAGLLPPVAADSDLAAALAAPLPETLGAYIEQAVAAGTIPVASAAVLGEVLRLQNEARAEVPPDRRDSIPSNLDPGWLVLASTESAREFHKAYLRRRDEWRGGGPTTHFHAYVTNPVREDLARARTLASRRGKKALSMGQALGVVVGDWLAEHDPLRKAAGTRRLPDTATIPGSRYVPADVDRHVRARTADACIVPFCDATMWLHRSHRIPHRDGGSREAGQLDLLCPYHHFLYETDCIQITGPADAPIVTDSVGRPIDQRRTWLIRSDESPWKELRESANRSPPSSSSRSSPPKGNDPPPASGTRLPKGIPEPPTAGVG